MIEWAAQNRWGVRLDWGPVGASMLVEGAPGECAVVVVDVLSFTTAVSVAVEQGTTVLPYRWRDSTAQTYADEQRAALASGRRAATPESPWSLSPAALRAAPAIDRLVLPSPNGSTISSAVPSHIPLLAGCLRNAHATAQWLASRGFGTPERPVLVIPAGERWPDQSLRPALEDLIGAGAVIARLDAPSPSPEAVAARAAFEALGPEALRPCVSGVELDGGGFTADVDIAMELDTCEVAAVRESGPAFVATPKTPATPAAPATQAGPATPAGPGPSPA